MAVDIIARALAMKGGGSGSTEKDPTVPSYVKTITQKDIQSWNTVTNKEDKSNKVTSISSSSTDKEYPSAKCVFDLVGNIETLLKEV